MPESRRHGSACSPTQPHGGHDASRSRPSAICCKVEAVGHLLQAVRPSSHLPCAKARTSADGGKVMWGHPFLRFDSLGGGGFTMRIRVPLPHLPRPKKKKGLPLAESAASSESNKAGIEGTRGAPSSLMLLRAESIEETADQGVAQEANFPSPCSATGLFSFFFLKKNKSFCALCSHSSSSIFYFFFGPRGEEGRRHSWARGRGPGHHETRPPTLSPLLFLSPARPHLGFQTSSQRLLLPSHPPSCDSPPPFRFPLTFLPSELQSSLARRAGPVKPPMTAPSAAAEEF